MPDLQGLIEVLSAVERARRLRGNPEIGRCIEHDAVRKHLLALEAQTYPSGLCADAHGEHGSATAVGGSRFMKVGHA